MAQLRHLPIDAETKVIMNGIPFVYEQSVQRSAQEYAKERIEAFRAGIARTPDWVNKRLVEKSGDDKLQIRWDMELETWILERWIDGTVDKVNDGYWCLLTVLANKFHQTPMLNEQYVDQLVEYLKAHDLQNVDPQQYIRDKRNLCNKIKEENRKKGDEMLMAAIDSMSLRQIQNFIGVHRAIHTGETIVAHGADEKSLERMEAASNAADKAAEDAGVLARDTVPVNKAMNQGMHPKIYTRDPR